MIIPVDVGNKPAWADGVVNNLEGVSMLSKRYNDGVTYSKQPQQRDADEDSKKDPGSPNVGVETIVKASGDNRREHHGL